MNTFIIIIEQGFMSVKYRKPYAWLASDNEDLLYNKDLDSPPVLEELNIGNGRQMAFEKELFNKLRDAFEGITDGDVYGKGMPIDNHPIKK